MRCLKRFKKKKPIISLVKLCLDEVYGRPISNISNKKLFATRSLVLIKSYFLKMPMYLVRGGIKRVKSSKTTKNRNILRTKKLLKKTYDRANKNIDFTLQEPPGDIRICHVNGKGNGFTKKCFFFLISIIFYSYDSITREK